MLYLVTYDLKNKEKDYNNLYESIKNAGVSWWHYFESVWLIQTNSSIAECFNKIHSTMDDDDLLFIVEVTRQLRQGWLPQKAWDWIKQHDA